MARRISDAIESCINRAVEALEIPQAVKESIEWEISPALIPTGREMALAYMVAISLPVPGSVEEVLRFWPPSGPSRPIQSALLECCLAPARCSRRSVSERQ